LYSCSISAAMASHFGPGAAGEDDLLKDFGMLGAFFGDDVADTPGPYDQYP